MKRLFLMAGLVAVFGMTSPNLYADHHEDDAMEQVDESDEMAEDAAEAEEDMEEASTEPASTAAPAPMDEPTTVEEKTFHQVIKQKFIEGDPGFMAFVVVCLVLGLALAIERIIYLAMATSNSKKLIAQVEEALASGGVEAAKEVCRNTSGPVASIFYQGLLRQPEGVEAVEKAVVSYGGVQMALLEKGVSWISLFIALAPMLGFMGTVIGMIKAFDDIAQAANLNISIVAGGIGVALITTVSGLIVAMILQVFYNYIVAKIDSIVMDMEEASIELVDLVSEK